MFPINSGAKQGCVLAPMLFGIFFSLLLSKALSKSQDGIFIHPRNDGKLFKPICLCAKTKVMKVLIGKLLFADDTALVACIPDTYQRLINQFDLA